MLPVADAQWTSLQMKMYVCVYENHLQNFTLTALSHRKNRKKKTHLRLFLFAGILLCSIIFQMLQPLFVYQISFTARYAFAARAQPSALG